MLSVTHDITDRKCAETAASQLALIVESSDDAIVGKSLDGKIVSWNTGAERIYGYTASEAVGQPIGILVPPEERDELPEILERLKRDERIQHYETVRARKDGERINVSMSISPVKDGEGKVIGASAIARDITGRKHVEAELQKSEAHFRSLIRDAPYGIYRVTLNGQFLHVNPALVTMLGYDSEEELMRRNMEKDIYRDPQSLRSLIAEHAHTDDFRAVETEWRRKDAKIITVKMTGHPVFQKKNIP